jgi:phosphate starvation-inducible protein PhoH
MDKIQEDGVAAVATNATGVGVVGTGDDSKGMTWASQKKNKKKIRSIITQKPLSRIPQ